jgi:hypothetical protein
MNVSDASVRRSASATFAGIVASIHTGNANDGPQHSGFQVGSPSAERRRHATHGDFGGGVGGVGGAGSGTGTLIYTPHHGSSVTFCNAAGLAGNGPPSVGFPSSSSIRHSGGHLTQRPSTFNFDHHGRGAVNDSQLDVTRCSMLRRSCSSSTLVVCSSDTAITASAPASPSMSACRSSALPTITTSMTTTTIVSSGTGAPSLVSGRELHRNGTAIQQRRATSGDHVRRRRVIDVDEGREPTDGIGRRDVDDRWWNGRVNLSPAADAGRGCSCGIAARTATDSRPGIGGTWFLRRPDGGNYRRRWRRRRFDMQQDRPGDAVRQLPVCQPVTGGIPREHTEHRRWQQHRVQQLHRSDCSCRNRGDVLLLINNTFT